MHPFNGAFVSEENANFLAVFQEKDVRNRQWERSILAISWGLAKEGFGIEQMIEETDNEITKCTMKIIIP